MKKLDTKLFWSNIEFLCDRKKISTADLSRLAEVEGQSLYNGRKKESLLSLQNTMAICETLGITVEDAFGIDFKHLQEQIDSRQKELDLLKAKLGAEGE